MASLAALMGARICRHRCERYARRLWRCPARSSRQKPGLSAISSNLSWEAAMAPIGLYGLIKIVHIGNDNKFIRAETEIAHCLGSVVKIEFQPAKVIRICFFHCNPHIWR